VRRIKYRKGLKVDLSVWQVLMDKYSLLDPSHHIPESPRFDLSNQPFLILVDQLGRRGLNAGVQRDPQGRKIYWLEYLRNGEKFMHTCRESLQELLYEIDSVLFERRRQLSKRPKRA
jgi:hypothetical protein